MKTSTLLNRRTMRKLQLAAMTTALVAAGSGAYAAEGEATTGVAPEAIVDGKIGFVLTTFHWAVHATEQKTECPDGPNDGPREQYAKLFPKQEGVQRTVLETELAREAAVWFPDTETADLGFKEPVSKVAPGVNLDGKVSADDFTSPEGETGIDNQFYRMLGCIDDYRPGGSLYHFNNFYMQSRNYFRILIELSNVDDLTNDDDVTVNLYRGMDPLLTDATGNAFLPYGTQRIDTRWGKKFQAQFKGTIKDGVLTTAPADIHIPYNYAFTDFGVIRMRDSQLKVSLTAEGASGMWGGYIDYDSFYRALNGALGTHSLSYGRQAAPTMYRAMEKLADGFPDAKGKNTAISGAIAVTFRQTFIKRPQMEVASEGAAPEQATSEQRSTQRAFR